MGVHEAVTVRAPAKVNLGLGVGAPDADGYHRLATVFLALSVSDTVTVGPSSLAGSVTVEVNGPDAPAVPVDGSNLAARAAQLVAGSDPADRLAAEGLRIVIDKQIPVAAGMAGGSADAAATLLACDALWRTDLSRDRLDELAAGLGADVPFALHGGCAIGHGRGDRLSPVLGHGVWHWVLLCADGELSTPQVYAECDRLREGRPVLEPEVPAPLMQALRSGDPAALGRALSNDLQAAAVSLRPELDLVLEQALDVGAPGAIVCGSGPTVAVLADDEQHAAELAVALSDAPGVRRVLRAHGPVPGARVVEVATHHVAG